MRYRLKLERAEREHLTVLAPTAKASDRKIVHARAVLLCDVDPYAHGKVWRIVDVAATLGSAFPAEEPRRLAQRLGMPPHTKHGS